jgi:hypothetical protein
MSQKDLPEAGASPSGPNAGSSSEPPKTEPNPPAKSPGRLSRAANAGLRWAAGLGVVFVLGVALVWALRVLPQTQEIRQLRLDQDAAQQQLSDLQDQVKSLSPLEDENASLKTDLSQANDHLSLLSVLVDVTTAQLALAQDNPLGAQAALQGSDAKLHGLQSGLDTQGAQSIQAIRDRLSLVNGELQTDHFAAQRDLEVVANNLLDAEQTLFPTPTP